MQPKDTEERRRAIDRVNRAYADEDYDRYERLIERYCHRFGFDGDYGLFEDACTDDPPLWISVGSLPDGRFAELIGFMDIDGVWCVFHAMVPPTKKFKRELGWR